MMNLEQQICDCVLNSCSKVFRQLLGTCKLEMILVENSSALLIRCPNLWTEKQIRGFLIGAIGNTLHGLGIDRAVMDDGEGFISYYEWDLTNMSFKGYFVNGDLNNLKIVPIPSDEDLMDAI